MEVDELLLSSRDVRMGESGVLGRDWVHERGFDSNGSLIFRDCRGWGKLDC